ncbi:MAG TPA: PQQ-dependent dehydrogenase, methanol/ethanol family [Vicinamibacterales bacterium]|nr:PQQ-dependent dehydrogenase, methanol/ethanol family [Vicinamibacterales bacterium]
MRIDCRSTYFGTAIVISVVLAASLSARRLPLAAQAPATALVVDDAALANEAGGDNWLAFGRTYSEQRFSPLTQVNDSTVSRLAPDWVLELPTDRGLVSTPLVVDGVMYFIGSMNVVRAVNATSGAVLWEFDPELRAAAGQMRAGWDHNRGIGFWKGKVYLATWDGRLIALDARTGKEVWRVRTFETDKPLYITGAPKIFKGKVLIGNGGTEHGPSRGYVTAYDAETGKQAWRFYIVPGNPADGFENDAMRMAASTWTGQWWLHGGGGNAWHGFTYDADLDQLYIGTGNGSPWNRKIRSPEGGDNLFLCSIVALNPDTGEYKWHYQTTPGETWDFNSNMDIVLADLPIEGRSRKVILHAPKNGFFYVIDRANGKLISAEPFTRTTWATRIDKETGRPVEVEGARYERGVATVAPTPIGAHSWHAMSFNPKTGLAYYPAMHMTATFNDKGFDAKTWRATPWSIGYGVGGQFISGASRPGTSLSSLQAWDPVKQRLAWEVPMDGVFHPGTMTTAGNLVFQGRVDGSLRAYTADTGKEVWRRDLGLGISAPPITYAVNGKQYVAILVGWGGAMAGLGGPISVTHGWSYGVHKRYLVSFALDGKAALPVQPPPSFATPLQADFTVNATLAQAGAQSYLQCVGCHGPGAVAAGMAPDLRAAFAVTSLEQFARIVRGGARSARGMPTYATITDQELAALQHYIRQQADLALRSKP